MSARSRGIAIAALAAVVAIGLVGCEAVPGSGPVQSGLSDLRQAEQYVQFNPLGPVAGSSQEDIVRGFVQAAASSDEDYAVAREFLVPGYADQWDPSYGVLIDDGSRPYTAEGDTAGALELDAIAKVDAEGVLLPVAPGPSTDMRFEFEQVAGEWRIASAPAGIILDRATFTAVWSSHQLYFVGADGRLVPESRWFLSRAAIATEIVNGLLAGPSERMAKVVHSGFPPGTALASGAVTVVDGRARIDLTSEVLDAGPEVTEEMYRQLRESLRTVSGVSGVDLLADGTEVRLPADVREEQTPVLESSNPSVLRDGAFGTVASGEFIDLGGIGRAIAVAAPNAITLAPDGGSAAVRGADGVSRVEEESRTSVDSRAGLLAPSYDSLGYIWTVDAAGELLATGTSGQNLRVAAPWLVGSRAVAVRVSPDGSRIAALVPADEGSGTVLVAGVVRDAQGVPTATTEAADAQMWVTGDPLDLDWIDPLRFAALSGAGAAAKITVGGPGLFANEQGSVPEGVQISSGGSRAQLRVLSEDGELYMSQGNGWQKSLSGVDVLAKRG